MLLLCLYLQIVIAGLAVFTLLVVPMVYQFTSLVGHLFLSVIGYITSFIGSYGNVICIREEALEVW